jgi:hypothetical protein
MWQTSCNVRDYYRAEAKAADRTRRDQADAQYAVREGKAEAAREAARDGYVPKAVIRCAKLIAKHVHDGNVSTAIRRSKSWRLAIGTCSTTRWNMPSQCSG